MKFLTIILLSLIYFSTHPTFAYDPRDVSKSQKIKISELNQRMEQIEMIDGTPKRKFKKLQPIWANASTLKGAIKKAKREAAKIGADAIIEVRRHQ